MFFPFPPFWQAAAPGVNRPVIRILPLLLSVIFNLMPMEAFAQGPVNSTIGAVLCYIAGMMYGNFGRALASIAIATLGVQAMLGRIRWESAIIVGIGIAVFFGAPAIVATFLAVIGTVTLGC